MTDMKQVIWVFGASASGKQTFIEQILHNPKLVDELGLKSESISVCSESIDNIGNVGNRGVVRARSGIVDSVINLLKTSDIVLIKWQYIDTENKTIENLLNKLPNIKHKAICLKVTPDEAKTRLASKTWWNKAWDIEDYINKEYKLVENSIQSLPSEIGITTVSSGADKDFKVLAN